MTIIYRSVKGSNLTPSEVDGNFSDLDGRVASVESAGALKSIDTISVAGNVMTITYTDATTDVVTVPTSTWNMRGEFSAVSYAVNDVFSYRGSLYLVLQAHTGVDPFDPGRQISGNDVYQLLLQIQPAPAIEIGPDSDGIFMPTLAEANCYMRANDSMTFVVPSDATTDFPINTEFHVRLSASGTLTISPETTDITISYKSDRLLEIDDEGGVVTLKKWAAGEWDAFGNLAAA